MTGDAAGWFRRPPRLTPRLVQSAAVAFVLLIAAYFAQQWLVLLPARLTVQYVSSPTEAQPIAGAMRVANGDTLYHDYRVERPVLPLTYGYLFYEVPGRIARVLGVTGVRGVMVTGKVLTLLSLVGVLAIVALVHLEGAPRRWLASFAAVLPLFCFPYPAEWGAKFLPDIPALFLSLAGWVVARQAWKSECRCKWAFLAGAVVLWTIKFHVKPIVLHGELLFAAEALLAGHAAERWRRALTGVVTGGALIAAAGATMLLLNAATGGLYYLNLVTSKAVLPVSPAHVLEPLGKWEMGNNVLLVAMTVFALLRCRGNIWFRAFLLTLTVDLLLMAMQGASTNYLIGSIVVWGLAVRYDLAGRECTSLDEEAVPDLRRQRGTAAVVLLMGAMVFGLWRNSGDVNLEFWERGRVRAAHLDAVLDQMNQAEGEVLMLDVYLALQSGRSYLFADAFHAGLLAEAGVVDLSDVEERVARREYALIVATPYLRWEFTYHGATMFPRRLRAVILENYRLHRHGGLLLLTPKPPVAEQEDGE